MIHSNHEVVEILDNLLKRTHEVYQLLEPGEEHKEGTAFVATQVILARMAIRVGCGEVDARCGAGSTLSADFVTQWENVKNCLLRIANSDHHRGCPAGFGCLLRDCQREGPTSLKFAEMMQVLSELAFTPAPVQPFPLLDRYASWMTSAELDESRAFELAELSSLPNSPGGVVSFGEVPGMGWEADFKAYFLKRSKVLTFVAVVGGVASISVAAGVAAFNKSWWDTVFLWVFVVLLSLTHLLSRLPSLYVSLALVSFAPFAGTAAVIMVPSLLLLYAACPRHILRWVSIVVWIGSAVGRGFAIEYETLLVPLACVALLGELQVQAVAPVIKYELAACMKKQQKGAQYGPMVKRLLASFDFQQAKSLSKMQHKIATEAACIQSNIQVLQRRVDLKTDVSSRVAVIAECCSHIAELSGGTVQAEEEPSIPHHDVMINPLQRDIGTLSGNNTTTNTTLHEDTPQGSVKGDDEESPTLLPPGIGGLEVLVRANQGVQQAKHGREQQQQQQQQQHQQHTGERSTQNSMISHKSESSHTTPVLEYLSTDALKRLYVKCGEEEIPYASEIAEVLREDPAIRRVMSLQEQTPAQAALEKAVSKALTALDMAGYTEYSLEEFQELFKDVGRKPVTIRARSRSRTNKLNVKSGSHANGVVASPSLQHPTATTAKAARTELLFGTVGKLKKARTPTTSELGAHLGVVIVELVDKKLGKVLAWNQYMQTNCYLLQEEVLGMAFQTLLTTQRDLTTVTAATVSAIEGSAVDPFTLSFARGVGEKVKFRVSAAAVYAGGGAHVSHTRRGGVKEEVAGITLLCTVVAPERFESQTKLNVFGWFLDQLQRPLETTKRYVTKHRQALLAEGGCTKEETIVFADVLAEHTKRLLEITRQIKPLTQLTVFHHPMDLQATFSKLLADHEALSSAKGVFLELVYDDDLPSAV